MFLAVTAIDVAFVGALAALVAAFASPLSTYLAAAKAARASKTDRIYSQRLEAYDQAMTLAYQLQAHVVQSHNRFEGQFATEVERYDTMEILRSGRKGIEVHGSQRTADKLQELSEATSDFMTLVLGMPTNPAERQTDENRKALRAAHKRVTDSREELGRLIRADLGH